MLCEINFLSGPGHTAESPGCRLRSKKKPKISYQKMLSPVRRYKAKSTDPSVNLERGSTEVLHDNACETSGGNMQFKYSSSSPGLKNNDRHGL